MMRSAGVILVVVLVGNVLLEDIPALVNSTRTPGSSIRDENYCGSLVGGWIDP